MRRSLLYFLLLLLKFNSSFAQDLTGTWEGSLGGTEFLQVNIVQVKNTICGYTWDYLYNDHRDYCKAYFIGRYDGEENRWILTGTSFFKNSGNHILMRLVLSYSKSGSKKILEGDEFDDSSIFSYLTSQRVILVRVSNKPDSMMPNMIECIKTYGPKKKIAKANPVVPQKKKINPAPVTSKTPAKTKPPVTTKPPVANKPPVIIQKTDTLKKQVAPVVKLPVEKDNSPIARQMTVRKNKEMKRIVVNDRNITLSVFDNGVVDNDSVSVFYDGKLILSHQRLSEKAIVIPITLDEDNQTHEITLFAENLGSIAPNTALVVVKAGDKRYELFASASLTENAVIRFEYKPK